MPTATRRRREVPQPKAPETPAPEVEDVSDNGDNLYRGDPDAPAGTPDWLIARAISLEQERSRVQERVAANRRSLRDLDAQDALNEDQADFLDVWYPEKERGERRSKEDIEATRKAREAARKDGSR